MNKQKVFDKVLKNLTKQKSPCMLRDKTTCAYAQGKKRCAIGHLLDTDTLAMLKQANCLAVSVGYLDKDCPDIYKNIKQQLKIRTTKDLEFLLDLQGAHDSAAIQYMYINTPRPVDTKAWFFDFITEMKVIARRHNLKMRE